MPDVTIATDKTWEGTMLFEAGQQVEAKIVRVTLETRGEQFQRAGLEDGGDLTGEIWASKGDELEKFPIFPGNFEFRLASGLTIGVSNTSPTGDFFQTTVTLDGIDCTSDIVKVSVEFDAVRDHVSVWYRLRVHENPLVPSYRDTVVI